MVGNASRTRVSSVIWIFPSFSSIGTLKSTRTRTRLSRTSSSRTESFMVFLRARNRARARNRLHSWGPLPGSVARGQKIDATNPLAFPQSEQVVLCVHSLSLALRAFVRPKRQDKPHIQRLTHELFRNIVNGQRGKTSHYLPRY